MRAVITDFKKAETNIVSAIDYYPFGMVARTYASPEEYRYGFNGQERETELSESSTSAEYWMYDGRLGRRWNVDPVFYPWQSSYSCFNNSPIYFSDPLGLEGTPTVNVKHKVTANQTIYKLAKMYGVTEDAIRAANPQTQNRSQKDQINIDEILNIPVPANSPIALAQKVKPPLALPQPDNDNQNPITGWDSFPKLPLDDATQPNVNSVKEGEMKPASSYDYSQETIEGKFTDDMKYIFQGNSGNPFSRTGQIFSRDWGQASTSDKVDLVISAVPLLRIGKFVVVAETFHRVTKPAILVAAKKVGNFEKIVGTNPDILIENGKIILQGAKSGPFSGKKFPTGLDAINFF